MADEQLQLIIRKLEGLSDEFAELRDGVSKAIRLASHDPEMALTRARKVLEYVIRGLFEERYGEDPGTRPLENLLQRLNRDGHLPKRLYAYANHIRELGNLGTHAHGEKVTVRDVQTSLEELVAIIEWYFETVRPAPAPPPPPEPEPLVEPKKEVGSGQEPKPQPQPEPPPKPTPLTPRQILAVGLLLVGFIVFYFWGESGRAPNPSPTPTPRPTPAQNLEGTVWSGTSGGGRLKLEFNKDRKIICTTGFGVVTHSGEWELSGDTLSAKFPLTDVNGLSSLNGYVGKDMIRGDLVYFRLGEGGTVKYSFTVQREK